MFWNKIISRWRHAVPSNICRTVKFKVALWYAALYVASMLVGLILLYGYLHQSMLQHIDYSLKDSARALVNEYVTGGKTRSFGRSIPIEELPTESIVKFRSRFPELNVLLAYSSVLGTQTFYTVFGTQDGKLYLMRLENDGSIYSRQLPLDQHRRILQNVLRTRTENAGRDNVFFTLLGEDGKPLLEAVPQQKNLVARLPRKLPEDGAWTLPMEHHAGYRILAVPLFDHTTLVVGYNLTVLNRQLEYYASRYAIVMLIILIPGALCGWLVARRFVAGLNRLGEAAKAIAAGNFGRRVEKGGEGQEIDDLAEAFNTMSGNTKKLFDELRVVTDDIAHDLKTPLTRIRGMAEITVRGPRDWEIYQDTLGNIAEECDHMVSMINSMLEITRTESAIDQPLKDEVDFADMLRQAFEIYQMSALDHEVTMTAKIPAEAAPLHANKVKLQRVVSNLLDNALKFTPAGGKIEISLTRGADWYCFDVADNGPGIADENKARIFERFFRCDSSRTLPGNGLGLTMVRAIVQSHHGTIEVRDTPGGGATFRVRLPVAAPAA